MIIEQEKIKSYIEYESNVPKTKTLRASLIMMLMVCIPSALFGAHSDITSFTLIPLVIIFGIWAIYLLIDTNNKKVKFVLFLGTFSFFIAVTFLVAAYKFASTTSKVQSLYVILVFVLFIVVNVLNILNVLRLISKGYYQQKGKAENPMGLILAMAILGLSIGKTMVGRANQDVVVAILISIMLFMSFLYSIGMHNLLKYYYIRAMQRSANNL